MTIWVNVTIWGVTILSEDSIWNLNCLQSNSFENELVRNDHIKNIFFSSISNISTIGCLGVNEVFLGYDKNGYDKDGLDREGYDYDHRKLEFHEMNCETRYWGDFRCHSCNRTWSSAATWKGRLKSFKKYFRNRSIFLSI